MSIIVTGRNDDYGKAFLNRVGNFIGFLCPRIKNSNIEIVFVDWNGQPDKTDFFTAAVNNNKIDVNGCVTRIIKVPPEYHDEIAFQKKSKNSFFEYYAKTVGIRRARGRWILVTNPDIIFEKSLLDFILNEANLQNDTFYQADRYDFTFDIPYGTKYERAMALIKQSLKTVHGSSGVGACERTIETTVIDPFVYYKFPFQMRKNGNMETVAYIIRHDLEYNGFCHIDVNDSLSFIIADDFLREQEFDVKIEMPQTCFDLYTSAVGDFFLAHRDAWHANRGGYKESVNVFTIDTLLPIIFASGGLKRGMLKGRIYHQEHERSEMQTRNMTSMSLMMKMCKIFSHKKKAWVVNDENWGLKNKNLL